MAHTQQILKQVLNNILGMMNLRIVNANWGPRGFLKTFEQIRKAGIVPSQVVDVGASDGVWTLECMHIFPDAQYFLVDPLTQNKPKLEKLAHKYSNIQIWQGALGAETGTMPLHTHGDQSSFLESEYATRQQSGIKEVEIRPLDSFLGSELTPPSLIKCDVQGFELEVLKGASKCLESAELLLLEVSYIEVYKACPLAHEVIAFLGEKGFRIYDICTYAQRPYDRALFQSDIVFARNDSRLFEYKGYE